MRVLITRAEPAASRTAQKVREAGGDPIVWPLFEVADTGEPFDTTDEDGVVLTSANAVRILEQRGWQVKDKPLKAFCVGEKTAKTAERLGFSEIITADGDAAKLAALLRDRFAGGAVRLAYPAATQTAFDMTAAFENTGIKVKETKLYAMEPIVPGGKEITSILQQLGNGVVLAYSEKTIEHTLNVLATGLEYPVAGGLTLLAISQKVATSVLRYPWAHVYAADDPSEQAMMEILSKLTLRHVW